MPGARLRAKKQTGVSYMEVLIATVLIAVALVPAMEAMAPGLQSSAEHHSRNSRQFALSAKLDELLVRPFAELDAEALALASSSTASTLYSDAAATPDRRLVYLSRYDADNADTDDDPFTGIDAGLLWLRVTMEGASDTIETLISSYD